MTDTQQPDFGGEEYVILAMLAESLDDVERTRIAAQNRLRAVQQQTTALSDLQVDALTSHVVSLLDVEKQAVKALTKHFKATIPLYEWAANTPGIGERQAARLLGVIGDPATRAMPSQLWQYCGHGDPERSHCRRGKTVHHSPKAKMRVHMIAESCKRMNGEPDKNGKARTLSPYRVVYDEARVAWADRDTTDLHKMNHALRVAGKAILLDMWREATSLTRELEAVAA